MSAVRDQVFISYSHKDKERLDELLETLRPVQWNRRLDLWSDQQVQAGDRWHEEMRRAVDQRG